MNDPLTDSTINDALTTRWLGRPALYVPAAGSTNDVLLALAAAGAPAGTAVIADYQVRGRGRRGRRWQAPPGTSLLTSLLLRPGWPAERSYWLTMIAGLAVVQAINEVCGLAVGLKWPNDVVNERTGALYKMGGILVESRLAGRLVQAVVGIGVNVNVAAVDLPDGAVPPSSLLVETGAPVDRRRLLAVMLARFEALYEAADQGQSPQPAWDACLLTRNRPVIVSGAQSATGLAVGTDEWGRLLVRDAVGHVHAISAGDVSLRL